MRIADNNRETTPNTQIAYDARFVNEERIYYTSFNVCVCVVCTAQQVIAHHQCVCVCVWHTHATADERKAYVCLCFILEVCERALNDREINK